MIDHILAYALTHEVAINLYRINNRIDNHLFVLYNERVLDHMIAAAIRIIVCVWHSDVSYKMPIDVERGDELPYYRDLHIGCVRFVRGAWTSRASRLAAHAR
jgi:hypothetical protein